MTSKQQLETSDHSGFVEHLRFVHSSLLVGCLVAVIAVSAQQTSTPTRAYEQLNALLLLKDRWQDGAWLSSRVQETRASLVQKRKLGDYRVAALTYDETGVHHSMNFVAAGPQEAWCLTASDKTSRCIGPELYPLCDSDVQRKTNGSTCMWPTYRLTTSNAILNRGRSIATLADARDVWDALHDYHQLLLPEDILTGYRFSESAPPTRVSPDLASSKPEDATLIESRLVLHDDLLKWLRVQSTSFFKRYATAAEIVTGDDVKAECYIVIEDLLSTIILPANCISEELHLQQAVSQGWEQQFPTGTFAQSFPDLNELSQRLVDVPISDLRDHFRDEARRSGENIELIGARLPADKVAVWGTWILTAMSIYLWVTFRDFASRVTSDDKAWSIAWLGTSTEGGSQIAFMVSIGILPITIAYFAWHGLDLSHISEVAVSNALAFVASCIASFGVWRSRSHSLLACPAFRKV